MCDSVKSIYFFNAAPFLISGIISGGSPSSVIYLLSFSNILANKVRLS